MPNEIEPAYPTKYWIARGAPLDAVIPTLEDTYTLIFGHGRHKIENVPVEVGEEIVKKITTPVIFR